MMRIHLYNFVLLFFFPSMMMAQNATFRGKITSSKTGETLPAASVQVDSLGGVAADANGNYQISISPGKHKLTFRFVSFREKNITVDVKAGEIRTLNVAMDETYNELKLVVVSAGKFEQKIEDVTISMEVLKPNLVEDKNTTSMDDAINQVPGVNIMDGQANIRGGSGWSYGAGSRVQILVDDLPMLAADANDTKWSFLPVENLEQVEVIKGASSVLFGSSALNGVINIRTAYPKEKPLTKINYFTGIYDAAKIRLNDTTFTVNPAGTFPQLNSGMNFLHSRRINNFDLVVGGNMFIDQGYRKGENEQRGRINFNSRYRFKKIEGLSAGVNLNTMVTDGTLFFLWKNDAAGGYTPAPSTLSGYTTYRTNIDPFVSYFDKHGNVHKLRTRWFNTTNQNNTNQNSTGNLYYAEYQYQKHFSEKVTLTCGLVEQHSTVKSQMYGDHHGDQLAVYTQGDIKWKRFTFSIGGRAEQNKVDSVRDNWTPVFRSGLNIHVLKETYLRASIGQGYRFPSIAEKFVRTAIGSINIYPNTNLQAEKGLSTEIGARQGLKFGSWSGYLDAAVFQNNYKNMIEFVFAQWGPFTDPFIGNGFKSVNVGDTRIKGIDLSFMARGTIAGAVVATVFAGYTYIDPRQLTYDSSYIAKIGIYNYQGSDSSNFLKYRYNHLLKADIEFGYRKFSLGVGLRYNSRMVNVDKIFVSGLLDFSYPPGLGIGHYMKYHRYGDAVYDLRSSWQFNKFIRCSFIVKNLFNYIYMERPADMQPPRTWVVQLGFTF